MCVLIDMIVLLLLGQGWKHLDLNFLHNDSNVTIDCNSLHGSVKECVPSDLEVVGLIPSWNI